MDLQLNQSGIRGVSSAVMVEENDKHGYLLAFKALIPS